jgi:formylglycine-generating enzyme required for sulfatase activity
MDGLIPLTVGKDWITKLYKQLSKKRKKKEKDLEKIKEIMSGVDPLVLVKYYVDPDSQEVNPAETRVEDFNVSRQSTFKKLNDFFNYTDLTNPGNRVMFFLSDAGMGKTSLLAMLKLIDLTTFLPRKYSFELFKLGENTLQEIEKIEGKRKTILLLDSLDEDKTAVGRVEERILEILDLTKNFHKVIITCRTQFFPARMESPGKIELGGYKCYAKYLSFFDNEKVDEYLRKRFSKKILIFKLKDKRKINKAKKIIDKMGSLRCRPMLLAHIDDFMKNESKLTGDMDEYEVYNVLLDNWLAREETKTRKPKEELLKACMLLAVEMQIKKVRAIPGTDLRKLVASFPGIERVESIDVEGRSLLNKNSQGDYRFSHYSIQEFLVAKYILANPGEKLIEETGITDFIWKMLLVIVRIPGITRMRQLGIETIPDFVIKKLLEIEWIKIPAGRFQMGSKEYSGETVHTVSLDSFYMSKTVVTFDQYGLFCVETGRDNPGDKGWGRGNRPVINVSWNDANEFCKWLSGIIGKKVHLPTEAQWEYACRAETTGERYGKLEDIAWYGDNSNRRTHPVAQKQPNAYGLYDMLGNVWEWCNDYYGKYPNKSVTNPTGPKYGPLRILRGGGWLNDGRYARSAYRCGSDPAVRSYDSGLRLARGQDYPAGQAGRRAEQRERIATKRRSPRQ